MNELTLSNTRLPVVCACDYMAASEPFFHADRRLDFHVLIYVTEGVIHVTEEDARYECRKGELLFLKAGLHHFGETEIPKGTTWYYVHFYEPEEELPAFSYDAGPVDYHEPLQFLLPLPKQASVLPEGRTAEGIRELCELLHSDRPTKRWQANAAFFEVLSELALSVPKETGEHDLAGQIADYLKEHSDSAFDSAKVCEHFYRSYSYLAAVFRKSRGQSMQEYHRDVRMREAAALLRRTMLPIGTVAETVGFRDMLYFSRCFHAVFGMSPRDYRKKLGEIY